MRLLVLIAICVSLTAQKRLPLRPGTSGGGGGGGIPAWVTDGAYVAPLETAPALSPGQGVVNQYGLCLFRITSQGGPDYSLPNALNRNNRWMLSLTASGGRQLVWVGEPVGPPTCSIAVGTPFLPAGYPADIGNRAIQWSRAEDYVAYTMGGTGITGDKLYEMRCTANCTLPTATWVFNVLRDFSGNDSFGVPWIDTQNKTFCASGSPPTCPKVGVYPGLVLNLNWISADADYFIFSIRGGSKYEYGACMYRHSTAFLGCRYLDVNGQLPASATPPFPGTSAQGNGPMAPWNFVSGNYMVYQINGDIDVPGAVNSPRFYRKPLPTARVQDWENAESVTGLTTVGHGSVTQFGIGSKGPSEAPSYHGFCSGEVNWVGGYRVWPDIGATISDPNVGVPSFNTLNITRRLDGYGWHISMSPRPDRGNWVASTFYRASPTPDVCLGPTPNPIFSREIVLHKISDPITAVDTAGVLPVPYPPLIRLGQHFSTAFSATYDCQGHGNISIDGTRIIFKSNMTGGAGGSNSTACGASDYGSYMLFPVPTPP